MHRDNEASILATSHEPPAAKQGAMRTSGDVLTPGRGAPTPNDADHSESAVRLTQPTLSPSCRSSTPASEKTNTHRLRAHLALSIYPGILCRNLHRGCAASGRGIGHASLRASEEDLWRDRVHEGHDRSPRVEKASRARNARRVLVRRGIPRPVKRLVHGNRALAARCVHWVVVRVIPAFRLNYAGRHGRPRKRSETILWFRSAAAAEQTKLF